MTQDQLRTAAIAKLAADGITIHPDSKLPSIVSAVSMLTGRPWLYYMSQVDFVRAYVDPAAQPREPAKFKPMIPHRHPRRDEFANLPRPIAMAGVGNGGDNGMGRGR